MAIAYLKAEGQVVNYLAFKGDDGTMLISCGPNLSLNH
jgi:hypothetical protein